MSRSGILTKEAVSGASEDNLVAAARGGDVEAFGALFERHKGSVYAFVLRSAGRREDAEDIAAETFRKAWTAIARFKGQSSLLTWLCRIAVNLCIDHARSNKNRVELATDMELDADELRPWQVSGADVESEVINKWRIESALASLPMSHRMLVVLCDIQGLTCNEAAEVAGCSVMSVRTRLFRARRKLRAILADVIEGVN
jgi:RNA polymerase sigma-70 factor, ECF subfamily